MSGRLQQALLYDFQTIHDLWLLRIPNWLVTNKYHNKQSMGYLLSVFSILVLTHSFTFLFPRLSSLSVFRESRYSLLLPCPPPPWRSSWSSLLLLFHHVAAHGPGHWPVANIASSILVIAASKLSSILLILAVVTSISDNQARMLERDEGLNQY